MRFREFRLWLSSGRTGKKICVDIDKVVTFTDEPGPSVYVTWTGKFSGGESLAISYEDFFKILVGA